jgi:hypothetical protein
LNTSDEAIKYLSKVYQLITNEEKYSIHDRLTLSNKVDVIIDSLIEIEEKLKGRKE